MSVVQITEKNVNAVFHRPGLVLLKFYGPKCSHCRTFEPIFNAVSNEFPQALFAGVNTAEEFTLAGEFKIGSLPTLIILKDGKLALNHVGTMTPKQLRGVVQSLL